MKPGKAMRRLYEIMDEIRDELLPIMEHVELPAVQKYAVRRLLRGADELIWQAMEIIDDAVEGKNGENDAE